MFPRLTGALQPSIVDGEEIELKISGRSTWALRAKMRPCLLPTDYPADDELGMVTVLPHS